MHVVEGISDRVVALDHGVKIAEGSFDEVATDPQRRRGLPRPARDERRRERDRMPSAAARARPRRHLLRPDPHPRGRLACEVDEGELVCLLGGNASGKSTTLKTMPRHRQAARGPRAASTGEDVTERDTSYRIGQGHGDRAREPAPVRADDRAREPRDGRLPARRRRARRTSSASTTLFPLLYERRKQLAGTLSGGEQQMVAMGRALMSQPKLLLMDEPSMGLAPILVERNFEIIQQVHESGVAILVVEQNANVSLSIADRGYVLQTGRIVLSGAASTLLQHEDLRKAYLGRWRRRPARLASGTGFRSSGSASTSTAAPRARSRTPCARPTAATWPTGTSTAPRGSTGSSSSRRFAEPSRG